MDQFSLECHVVDGEIHCELEKRHWTDEAGGGSGWGSSEIRNFIVDDVKKLDETVGIAAHWLHERLMDEG